jgi:VanZ like family
MPAVIPIVAAVDLCPEFGMAERTQEKSGRLPGRLAAASVRVRVIAQPAARRLADAAQAVRLSRRAWLAAATVPVLLAYAVILLWPFDWAPAGYFENKAEFLPERGVRFAEPGIARTYVPPGWVAEAMRTQELAVRLQVRPLAAEQTGPARIMTLSLGPDRRDFTIGQEKADLILRLRTPASSLNGTIDAAPVARIPDVFRSMRWSTIGLRIKPGQLELAVDGRVAARRSLPAEPFENWNPFYRFALGNELTNNRPWLGEIRHAVVRAGNMEVDYARPGELATPDNFWLLWSMPRLIPLQYFSAKDIIRNVILFIPLGALIGAWLGRRGTWRAILLFAVISASFETLQLFLPVRSPSIDDVIANTLGGALGLLLLRWLRPLAAAAAREDA